MCQNKAWGGQSVVLVVFTARALFIVLKKSELGGISKKVVGVVREPERQRAKAGGW